MLRLFAMLSRISLACCALLVAFTACSRRETAVEKGNRTQTLHIGNTAEPRDLDPHIVTAACDANIVRSLLEGLTELDPHDSHPVPAVATNWEVSADQLTWTFHLRDTARWSNGDPVVADDFIYALHRALSPALGSEYAYLLFPLRNAERFQTGKLTDFSQVGVHAPDAHTLVFQINNPTPYLPTLTALPIWFPLPRATIEKFGRMDQRGTAWTRAENFVGNGAFVLSQWSPNQFIKITKSPTYWDRDSVKLKEAVFYPIESPNTEEAAFRAGQLHVTGLNTPTDKLTGYQQDPARAGQLHVSSMLTTAFLRLNCAKPPFTDPRVRRALSLAIDRVQMTTRILHTSLAASSLTPPDCAGYNAGTSVPFNVAEAQRLLAEAGFPEGKNLPRLEIMFPHTGEDGMAIMETLQAMWRKNLGIDVALIQQEARVYEEEMQHGQYQMAFYAWLGDYLDPSTFLELMVTGGGNNQTGWSNARYDELVNKARTAPNQAARYKEYQEAESLLLAEAPIIPMYYYMRRELRAPSVHGWYSNLLDTHPLKFVSLEK